jgi:hypothetical protein
MPFSQMRPHTEIDMKLRDRILKMVGVCGVFGAGFQWNAAQAQVNTIPQAPAGPRNRTGPSVKNVMALNTHLVIVRPFVTPSIWVCGNSGK